MNFDSFKAEWETKRVGDPTLVHVGVPEDQIYQCVSLVKQYLSEGYGIHAAYWGDAIDYWHNTNPTLLTKFDRITTQDVRRGDIVVLNGVNGNTAGHIGIATGNGNSSQFEMLEQNGQTGGGTGLNGDAIRTRYIARSRIAGVLRPKPVVAAAPPVVHPYTIQPIDSKKVVINKQTHKWGMNYDNFTAMANHPEGDAVVGDVKTVAAICHHNIGYRYYLEDAGVPSGYNVLDCDDYVAPPPPPPPAPPKIYTENTIDGIRYEAYDSPKSMYVARPTGTEKWSFEHIQTWRDFKSVQHLEYGMQVFIVGVAHHPIPPNGADYYMVDADFGDFKHTGKVNRLYGFNWSDLSAERPKVELQAVSIPPVAPPLSATALTKVSLLSADWKQSYRPFPKPVHYSAVRDLLVHDLSGQQPAMLLKKYDKALSATVGMVSAYGTVNKDGIDYYRLKTNNDPKFQFWYSAPKIDPDTKTPVLLLMPDMPLEPVNTLNRARDSLELVKSHIERDASQFADILPKWIKIKK